MNMACLKAFLALSLIYLVAGDGAKGMPPGPPGTGSSTSSLNTTASPPQTTTVPTSPPKNTTTTTTTTTTAKTTTTSTTITTPTTTPTPAPNTTTTTTTPKPTTTAAPTTTPKPPAPQPPTPHKWSVNSTANKVCLVLEAGIQVDLNYKDGNATKVYTVNVPPTATAKGYCDAKAENITLFFGEGNTVTFFIQKSGDGKNYDVETILVTVNASLPNTNASTLVALVHQVKEFSTPVSNSYKCMPEKKYNLTSADKVLHYDGNLVISHFQLQAFKNSTNANFDEARDCEGSETPDVVPIAVGCALAALVIIVLIAYLIGRRRSQARGYLSM